VADVNVLAVTGTVVRDLKISYTKNEYPIGRFKVAVNNRRKIDGKWEECGNYFEAVIFGPRAESLQKHLVQGRRVGIEGQMRQDTWIDKEQRQQSKTIIVIQSLTLLNKPPEEPEEAEEQKELQ